MADASRWLKEDNMFHLVENISHLSLLNQIWDFFWLRKSTALLYHVSCTCRELLPTICITEHSGEEVWREASIYLSFSALSHIPRRLCWKSITCRKDNSLLHNSHRIKAPALRKQLMFCLRHIKSLSLTSGYSLQYHPDYINLYVCTHWKNNFD